MRAVVHLPWWLALPLGAVAMLLNLAWQLALLAGRLVRWALR